MTTRSKARIAVALWLVLAFAVWNVIFDRVIVLAGRRYVYEASAAARRGERYLPIDERMPPAIRRGVWLASAVAAPIALFGVVAVLAGVSLDRRRGRGR